jgi:accessory gene regulator B
LTLEFLIAFIGMLILRPFLAGFHAKTELACIFMSFATMLISIMVGDMNILPSYLQIILIILLPIIGVIVAPVRLKKVEKSKTGVLKLLAGVTTIVLLFIDFYLLSSQILLISVILIYLLTLYQILKNYIKQQKNIKLQNNL